MSMSGSVLQINLSRGGVPKRPVAEAQATTNGLAGDVCAHPKIHGGPRQALLIVTAEAVDDLAAQGFPVYYGALGENLTVRGLDHREFRVGQRWRIGSQVWIEFTKLRQPCRQLDVYGAGAIQKAIYDKQVKAGNPATAVWAKAGIYAAVLEPGIIRPGDPFVFADQLV